VKYKQILITLNNKSTDSQKWKLHLNAQYNENLVLSLCSGTLNVGQIIYFNKLLNVPTTSRSFLNVYLMCLWILLKLFKRWTLWYQIIWFAVA